MTETTAIALIVDRSGSMSQLQAEGQSTIDSFINDQHDGNVLWTVVLFNHLYERPAFNTKAKPEVALEPRGMTALLDAVGRTIEDLGVEFANMAEDERPTKVIFAILTDGLENSSKMYTRQRVAELVKRQSDEWNWDFVYLATGLDQFAAEREATSINIPRMNTMAVADADHRAGGQSVSYYVEERRRGNEDIDLQAAAKSKGVKQNEG